MDSLFYIFLLSALVMYVDYYRTIGNWGTKYNGIGCVDDVLSGNAMQPMAYRVLVPWLCKVLGWEKNKDDYNAFIYFYIRFFSIAFGFSGAYLFFGGNWLYMLCLSMFFFISALYDYTDGYLEVGFFGLCLYLMLCGASLWLVPIIILLATLNRETSIFLVLSCAVIGIYWLLPFALGSFVLGYIIPRFVIGRRGRYCSFNMVGRNLSQIKGLLNHHFMLNEYFLFLVVLGLVLAGFLSNPSPLNIVYMAMFISLLVPSMWREIRVFGAIVMVMIPSVIGGAC